MKAWWVVFLFFLAWKLIVAIRVVVFFTVQWLWPVLRLGTSWRSTAFWLGTGRWSQLWHRFLKRKSIRIASYQRGFNRNIIYKWWFSHFSRMFDYWRVVVEWNSTSSLSLNCFRLLLLANKKNINACNLRLYTCKPARLRMHACRFHYHIILQLAVTRALENLWGSSQQLNLYASDDYFFQGHTMMAVSLWRSLKQRTHRNTH